MFVITKPDSSLRGLVSTRAMGALQTIYHFQPQFSSTLARGYPMAEGSTEFERLVSYVKWVLSKDKSTYKGGFFDLMSHYEDFETSAPLAYDDYTKRIAYTILINAFTMINRYREDIGWGLDLQFSLINHSCNPNCSLVYNHEFQLITTREIGQGKELTVSYVPLNMPRSIRKKQLNERFFFDCQCGYCRAAHDYYFSYNCPWCHMVVEDLTFEGLLHDVKGELATSVTCKGCNRVIETSTVKKIHRKMTTSYLLELHPQFNFGDEDSIVTQVSHLQPISVDDGYWKDCQTLLRSGIVPSYCYPLNVILPNIYTTEPELQAQITAILTFQGCVFNRIELNYQIREFVVQVAENGPSHLASSVVSLVERIKGFFSDDEEISYQLTQIQKKFAGVTSTDPWSTLKSILSNNGVAYKCKGQRLWVQMINRVFIEI